MITISAPFPRLRVTVTLPSQQFGDTKASEDSVNVLRSMNNAKTYTYIKRTGRHTLKLPLILSRMKAIELRRFVESYVSAPLLVSLPNGERWVGTFVVNPFEGTAEGVAGGWPGDEAVNVTLEISGTQDMQAELT